MTRWFAIGGLAYTGALVILALRLRHVERQVAKLRAQYVSDLIDARKPTPVDLRSSWGMVEHGGPLHGEVAVRRINENYDEILTAGAYLADGQYVTIRDGVAFPTPYPGD